MRQLSFFSHSPQGFNASVYYRLHVPLMTAQEMGLPIQIRLDTNLEGINVEERIKAFCESDVVVYYQPTGEFHLSNVRAAKSFLPSLMDEGEWKYPITFALDTDDNLFNVNPHNGAFKNLGIRDHEGREIPPGNVIGCIQGGEKKILWRDVRSLKPEEKPDERTIDIMRNRHTIDTYRGLLELADCVTCSTPAVEECVKRDAFPLRTRVFPNLVRFDHYPQIDLREDPKRIKILWQGGGAHYEDWYPLREALGRITKKYPEIHWIIWGVLYHWVTELIPPDRYTYLDWCPYQEYKLRLVMQGHDISIAPLTPNRFNDCRSAIKFYEGSVMKKPAATVAQNTGAYKAEIIPSTTGLLYNTPEEFEEKLSLLIENAALRKELASNAKDWVSENRDAFKKVPEWFFFMESLRKKIQWDQPRMPDSQWAKFIEDVAKSESQNGNGVPTDGNVQSVHEDVPAGSPGGR